MQGEREVQRCNQYINKLKKHGTKVIGETKGEHLITCMQCLKQKNGKCVYK